MSMQIINGYKIGDKFKSAVAKLISFDPTENIKGDNLQDALESVDKDIRNSIVTDGDDIDLDISPINADTLGGRYTATDITNIITNLSTLGTHKYYSFDVSNVDVNNAWGGTYVSLDKSYTIDIDYSKLKYYNAQFLPTAGYPSMVMVKSVSSTSLSIDYVRGTSGTITGKLFVEFVLE